MAKQDEGRDANVEFIIETSSQPKCKIFALPKRAIYEQNFTYTIV